MGDLSFVELLARQYKQRGENSGNWIDYLKVSFICGSVAIQILQPMFLYKYVHEILQLLGKCTCAYVCVYTCAFAHMHVPLHVHIYAHTPICSTYAHTLVYVYACMWISFHLNFVERNKQYASEADSLF